MESECLLCKMWARMPYAKRYSTPTTPSETEGALVIGYWVATRQTEGLVVRMCPKHMAVVTALDNQEEARKLAMAQQPPKQELPQHFQESLEGFQRRREQLISNVQAAAPQEPPKPVQEQPFVLGPGPLNNGNVTTPPPPMPVPAPAPLVMPVMQPYIDTTGQTVAQQPTEPLKNPNLPQAMLQGAALIDAPCLFCKVMVKQGEVHNCPLASGRGN